MMSQRAADLLASAAANSAGPGGIPQGIFLINGVPHSYQNQGYIVWPTGDGQLIAQPQYSLVPHTVYVTSGAGGAQPATNAYLQQATTPTTNAAALGAALVNGTTTAQQVGNNTPLSNGGGGGGMMQATPLAQAAGTTNAGGQNFSFAQASQAQISLTAAQNAQLRYAAAQMQSTPYVLVNGYNNQPQEMTYAQVANGPSDMNHSGQHQPQEYWPYEMESRRWNGNQAGNSSSQNGISLLSTMLPQQKLSPRKMNNSNGGTTTFNPPPPRYQSTPQRGSNPSNGAVLKPLNGDLSAEMNDTTPPPTPLGQEFQAQQQQQQC
jgi:hypothetical protein